MKTNEQEYADMLIEQYAKVTNLVEFGDIYKLAAECAINDVQNTIDALDRLPYCGQSGVIWYDYYNNLLNILKAKL